MHRHPDEQVELRDDTELSTFEAQGLDLDRSMWDTVSTSVIWLTVRRRRNG